MRINQNVVEDALFQIKNLEETLQENAKGILQSTMSEEIKQLVKESLRESKKNKEVDEQDDPEAETQNDPEEESVELEDETFDDDGDEIEDVDLDTQVPAAPDVEGDEETIDLTKASDAEVLKVFKAMGDEDGIVVKKEGDNVYSLTDGDNDYMIRMNESENMNDTIYEIELEDDLYETPMMDEEMDSMDDRNMMHYRDMMEDEYMMYGDEEEEEEEPEYENDEMMFEIEMEDQSDEFEDYEIEEGMDYEEDEVEVDSVMEAVKKSMKKSNVKGVGMGRGPKFSYGKTSDFPTKKQKEAFGGSKVKAMGTGKAEFKYKEGENMEKGSNTKVKKTETKEASRTYGNGSKSGRGLRKARLNNRNYEYNPFKISESRINEEVESLREKNEEYKKALDVFRTKLNEVAVFNSNLAYATRLFTEHSTTKQEKINILRRFDNVESLKESKNLYKSIKDELSSNTSRGETQITESIERNVNRTVSTGSAVNLIESKTYENPQFLRMKDLMTKIK